MSRKTKPLSFKEEAPFGHKDGELLYWPDASYLSVAVPAPLEQHLAHFGEALGMDAEEAAVFLLRNALWDSRRVREDFTPDRERYLKEFRAKARAGR